MNLDAIFEDLEAQGYFQSNVRSAEQPAVIAKVVRVELDFASHLLTSVLLGPDFLAGFELNNNQLRWLIIPAGNIQILRAEDHGSNLLKTEGNLASLLELKLLGKSIKIISSEQTVSGLLLDVSTEFIKLQSDSHYWIPLGSLGVVVVEKFSDLT